MQKNIICSGGGGLKIFSSVEKIKNWAIHAT
jgi:hypothetical protein